jgi:hypothetical protein
MALHIPKVNINKQDRLNWWTPELEEAKSHLKVLSQNYFNKDNRANRANQLEILKTARYDYKLLIRREKSLAFRKLVSKTDSVTSMAKLSKILTKKNADKRLGLLIKPDGTTCKKRPIIFGSSWTNTFLEAGKSGTRVSPKSL